MRTWMWWAVIAVVLTLSSACGKKPGSGKKKVAVSIFPIYDVTKRIAGDRLEVLLVLPPGKSEHGYDPTPKEIARLEGAKLGLAVGLDMDGWVEGIMRTAGGGGKIVRIGDKVPTMPIDVEPIGEDEAHEEGEHHDEHEGEKGEKEHEKEGEHHEEEHHDHKLGAPDPHVWLDPQRMATIVDAITAELSSIDPEGKATFEANAKALKDSIAKTDSDIAARSATWTKRTIVTFRDLTIRDGKGAPFVEGRRCRACSAVVTEERLACPACASRAGFEPFRAAETGRCPDRRLLGPGGGSLRPGDTSSSVRWRPGAPGRERRTGCPATARRG